MINISIKDGQNIKYSHYRFSLDSVKNLIITKISMIMQNVRKLFIQYLSLQSVSRVCCLYLCVINK